LAGSPGRFQALLTGSSVNLQPLVEKMTLATDSRFYKSVTTDCGSFWWFTLHSGKHQHWGAMLRFFFGLALAQTITALIVALYPTRPGFEKLLLAAFTIVLLAIVLSLWFGTITRQLGDRRVAAVKQQFLQEREKLNIKAERAKNRMAKKTQKEIEANARRAKTGANFKVGAAIAVAAGFGVMMMFTQFITLGLLTLTTAGGAVGGYLTRARREQDLLAAPEYKMIDPELVQVENVDVSNPGAAVAGDTIDSGPATHDESADHEKKSKG